MGTMWQTRLASAERLVREQVAIPTPKAGEVLVRVTHVGICGSDISAYFGKHPYVPAPIVLGHEFAGIVAAQGTPGQGPAVGTRVTVVPHISCGQCAPCQAGIFNLCEGLQVIGCQVSGAFGEYTPVPTHMALPISASISLEDAAMIEPAAVSYHAMRRAQAHDGDTVLVMGVGPIGAFALQCARVLGASRVLAADMAPERLALAQSLGADGAINLRDESLADGLTRLVGTPHAVQLFADCVGGNGAALDSMLALAGRGSRIAAIGILHHNAQVSQLINIAEHELTLYGSSMYVPQDYTAVIAAMEAGGIRTTGMVTHRFAFDQVPEAFALIESKREPFFKIMIENR